MADLAAALLSSIAAKNAEEDEAAAPPPSVSICSFFAPAREDFTGKDTGDALARGEARGASFIGVPAMVSGLALTAKKKGRGKKKAGRTST